MAQKRKSNQLKLILQAALRIAEEGGWDAVTIASIAKKARLKEDAVRGHLSDNSAILVKILKNHATEVASDVQDRLGDNWRDNLFEILMTRFDHAQKHRRAFAGILPFVARKPSGVPQHAKFFLKMIGDMLDLAKLPAKSCRPLQTVSFAVIYLSIVDVWKNDDTQDLSKTMAVIDQRLGFFEKVVDLKG